ncbi:MAG: hypothetical protein JWL90_385 [Chthoniobacteraceae bacterium]|nr:hypothetical protein [Chthoniobacteraceae bacterium]
MASAVEPHLGRSGKGRGDPENGFALFHQVEPIAGDDANVLRIVLEEIFFALMADQGHPLLFNLSFKLLNARFLFLMLGNFRQERVADRNRPGQHDQREDKAVEGMPDSRGCCKGRINRGAHLAHLTAVNCIVTKFFLDAQQLVIFGNPISSAKAAGFDLAGIGGDGDIRDRRVFGLT